MPRPAVKRKAASSPGKPTVRTKGEAQRSRFKVIPSRDEALELLEKRKVVGQMLRLIDDRLRSYFRASGEPLSLPDGSMCVDYRRTLRPQTPVHSLVAKAALVLKLKEMEIDEEDLKGRAAEVMGVAVELLEQAYKAIDIRSWPGFIYKTGIKEPILETIAKWDEQAAEFEATWHANRGEEPPPRNSYSGMYTHKGKPSLGIRASDIDEDSTGKTITERVPLDFKPEDEQPDE